MAALRTKQAPLKESYKTSPSSALVTLSSKGTLDGSSVTCKLSTGQALRTAGLHPMAGGDDPALSGELCSGDMLLDALVACSGVTFKAVATSMGVEIVGGEVTAEGDLDFRGTLGVERGVEVGFSKVRVRFLIEVAEGVVVEKEALERLGRVTDRYCVVLQSLKAEKEVSVKVKGQE